MFLIYTQTGLSACFFCVAQDAEFGTDDVTVRKAAGNFYFWF